MGWVRLIGTGNKPVITVGDMPLILMNVTLGRIFFRSLICHDWKSIINEYNKTFYVVMDNGVSSP